MKIALENQKYNTALFPTEWRCSAAIVGLVRYFKQQKIDFEMDYEYEDWLGIAYNREDLMEARYLDFAEDFFEDEFFHKKAEKLLESQEGDWTEEQIKQINEMLEKNAILRKTFEQKKFNGTNSAEILRLLKEQRYILIQESFKNKKNLYANFVFNKGRSKLFTDKNSLCRLWGYWVDVDRKTKGIAYQFDEKTFLTSDMWEFDWIPFAFSNTDESFFINNNVSIKALCRTADRLQEIMENAREQGQNSRTMLLRSMVEAKAFVDFDVEVISKKSDQEYFTSLFIRKKSLEALAKISNFSRLQFRYKLGKDKQGKDYWLDVQQEVIDCAINQTSLDSLIETLLKMKEKEGGGYLAVVIGILITLSIQWGEQDMDKEWKKKYAYSARKAGEETADKFLREGNTNKLKSYRQKLTSAIVFHDYDRVNEILLQLSAYIGISYSFAYPIFEDGEGNKEIAFAFINALDGNRNRTEQNQEEQ